MSSQINVMRETRVIETTYVSAIGQKEPIAHPCNCKTECPYGYDRTYCFPCYARLMKEHREAMTKREK